MFKDGTFVSAKIAKTLAKGSTEYDWRLSGYEVSSEQRAALVKLLSSKIDAAKAGTSKRRAAAVGAATAQETTKKAGASKAGAVKVGVQAAMARVATATATEATATATEATSTSRCSGACRLARPCPTETNKDGRGACGNLGCEDNGAVYGCKTCGIRLCSMECINAHMFEGRAKKPRLGPVQFHDWYAGE